MTTTPTDTFAPAGMSASERLNTPTECGCCGRSGLKVTVKMAHTTDGSIVWMGTGCAAKAMGVGVDLFRRYAKDADDVVRSAERAAAATTAKAEDDAWDAFLLAAAGPGARTEQIARLGGYGAARAAYKQTQEG